MIYLNFLEYLHNHLNPSNYVEIGIRKGNSLKFAKNFVIGIDPEFNIQHPISVPIKLFRCTSDDFFYQYNLREELYYRYMELGFIDGLHLFEYALRDFHNLERYSARESLILFDDIKPRNQAEASRKPSITTWTGDIWKIYYCLKKFRPQLKLFPLGTEPTGLLLVTELDSNSNKLWTNYDDIIEEFLSEKYPIYPPSNFFDLFIEPEEFIASDDFRKIQNSFVNRFK